MSHAAAASAASAAVAVARATRRRRRRWRVRQRFPSTEVRDGRCDQLRLDDVFPLLVVDPRALLPVTGVAQPVEEPVAVVAAEPMMDRRGPTASGVHFFKGLRGGGDGGGIRDRGPMEWSSSGGHAPGREARVLREHRGTTRAALVGGMSDEKTAGRKRRRKEKEFEKPRWSVYARACVRVCVYKPKRTGYEQRVKKKRRADFARSKKGVRFSSVRGLPCGGSIR